jgi:hypothetical protein
MAIWQDERKKAKICQECGKVRVERGHTRCKECLALHRGIRYDKYALPDPNRRYRSVSA